MVATIRDITVESFLSGEFRLDVNTLTSDDWYTAVSSVVNDLRLVPGLPSVKSIRKLLCWEHRDVKLELNSLLITHDVKGTPNTAITYALLHSQEEFPRGWKVAHELGVDEAPVTTKHLLLSQSKELLNLECVWVPHTEWGERGQVPDVFMYNATSATLSSVNTLKAWDAYYLKAAEESRTGPPGIAILMQMRNLAAEANAVYKTQAEASAERLASIETRLRYLGIW